ncbi:hypothetical protein B0J18DRAFT_63277 [Chaetomium sp. MPI-SDFR-AT-0129]|nr:hypothetical protein B0J18DRAFT_63277 [Chaetomium sp. MPI-SDFR-AT-0129]
MCGRYAMALRPSELRQLLQDDDMPVDDSPADDGDGAPRQSYNFAPGYHGVVYRADTPSHGAGGGHQRQANVDAGRRNDQAEHDVDDAKADDTTTHYKLQTMKWGLIPSWTKRHPSNPSHPSYPSLLKTINCRDDSLALPGGMWASMKTRKRCVIVAQGFYEWLSRPGGGPKDKVPHFVKRRDGGLMFFAGLWDCVRYEGGDGPGEGDGEGEKKGEGLYTYTVITTDSNKQLKFLHDRMPVILEAGSEGLWRWLDPKRTEWNGELQGLLKPFGGEVEVYPVSKEVGKVGNNSPSFVIPVASRENKGNIANFFAAAAAGGKEKKGGGGQGGVEVKGELGVSQGDEGTNTETKKVGGLGRMDNNDGMDTAKKGIKREADSFPTKEQPPPKRTASFKSASPNKQKPQARGKISATSNAQRSPVKARGKPDGSQKITKFFGNSA